MASSCTPLSYTPPPSPSRHTSPPSLPLGLSVKDYLEGKEGKHKELMYRASKAGAKAGGPGGEGLVPGVRRRFGGDGEATSYVESEDMAELKGIKTSLSRKQQV